MLALSSLALLAGGVALAAESSSALPARVERLRQAFESFSRHDCKTATPLARPLLGTSPRLPDEMEAMGYLMVVYCEQRSGDKAGAYADAIAGTRLEHSADELWHARLLLELEAERYDAAVATIEAMSEGRGAALSSIPDRAVSLTDLRLKEKGLTPLRRRYLKVLTSDAYAPESGPNLKDRFRLAYAIMLAEAGDREGARSVVAALKFPYSLRQASVDLRLRAFLPANLDVRAATEAMLEFDKEAAARHPDQLDPLLNVAADLRELGRPQEALQLLQTVSTRVEDPAAFTDREAKLMWWWDSVARSHAALGHYEEAVAALRKGGSVLEQGELNVSQTINLAELQINFRRGDEALKTLAAFEDPKRKGSGYGEMEMRYARGCASILAGRPGAAAADLAYVRAHEKDDAGALSSLLLCMGDLDGAAASYIRRLDDPETRISTLLELSDYDDPPVALPSDPTGGRFKALKERPDVKAAIARAGGTRRFNVQPADL